MMERTAMSSPPKVSSPPPGMSTIRRPKSTPNTVPAATTGVAIPRAIFVPRRITAGYVLLLVDVMVCDFDLMH